MERDKIGRIMRGVWLILFCVLSNALGAQEPLVQNKIFWKKVMREMPEFKRVFKKHKKYRLEIIYGQVNHKPGVLPDITLYRYGDAQAYYYPASTVKLAVALKTLQKLNISDTLGGDWYLQYGADSTVCGTYAYSTAAPRYLRINKAISASKAAAICGLNMEEFCALNKIEPDQEIQPGTTIKANATNAPLTVNQMLSEMLVYSNNAYYNMLFDFSYGESCGFNAKIKNTTRFLPCSGNNVTTTVPGVVINDNTLTTLRFNSTTIDDFDKQIFTNGLNVGRAVIKDDKKVKECKSFVRHNAIQLETLQQMLVELLFPGCLPEGSFFNINEQQRMFLIQQLGMKPSEDKFVSDSAYLRVKDDYTNFLYTGQKHEALPANIRIVNIIGQAYGFVTDCAYLADEKNGVDFFLAARIYVNKDKVLNDDKYEYVSIAYPFYEKLGKVIYEMEKKRAKEYTTNPGWLFQIFR